MLGTFHGCNQYLQVLYTGPDEYLNLTGRVGPGNIFLKSITFLNCHVFEENNF